MRIGVVREFMKVHTKADEASVAVAEAALRDLAKAGATLVDPGPGGGLFQDAIAAILPALDAPLLSAVYPEVFARGSNLTESGIILSGTANLSPTLTLRIVAESEPAISGEGLFAMEQYLRERGDRSIRHVADLIANSDLLQPCADRWRHRAAEGSARRPAHTHRAPDAQERRQHASAQAPYHRALDINGWHAQRTVLQMLVNKVMADNSLDALVYPTKTIPAPQLAAPVEPTNLTTVREKVAVVVDGEAYERTVERVVDLRAPLTPRLSSNSGNPTIVVPAGFVAEVYDRATVRGADGSKQPGDLLPPKAVALPVSMDFLGRPFSEPLLLRIAAAYEAATNHRRPPKDFGPLPGEP